MPCNFAKNGDGPHVYVVVQFLPGLSPIMCEWQNGHSFGSYASGISPKSKYASTFEFETSFLIFVIISFVIFCGEAIKNPFAYCVASTHSAPCGPCPLFWQSFVGHSGLSITWLENKM